ncbi:unnamed protein product [Acanthoscelides obtectus]|uniref:Major facilitator superfamily (MFS) profile domain-containing protein n=1 Tax=Acanthoscelides obtectus TaxID=200917 RepID=A0A9P0KF72_ACAOB|nr:unnamed protein product [Acanthoscelides obtectus]CAK1651014.1 Facilitated trehalose transporter Tret1 [Acanthoscelides obtectus]
MDCENTDKLLPQGETKNGNVEDLTKKIPSEEENAGNSTFLYISAVTADLLILSVGCGFSWTAPVFPILQSTDPNENPLGRPITPIEESWVASLYCLGAAIGPIFAGKFADRLGRKRTLIIISFPMIISLVILAFAKNIHIYYVTRFVMGITAGSAFNVLPMYLAEISEVRNRGTTGCLMAVFVVLSGLISFLIGPLLSIRLFTIFCCIPLLLFVIFFGLFIPETPLFLIASGKREKAENALIQLRSKHRDQIREEITKIEDSCAKQTSKSDISILFKEKGLRKALVISVILLLSQQLAGINAVMAFLNSIFEAAGSGASTYTSTVVIAVIQIIATIVAASAVEKLGRRLLLLVSTIGSCASLFLLGLYFYLKNSKFYDVTNIYWLPLASLVVYIIAFNVGLSCIPWTITHEIFPSNVQSIASSVASVSCFTASFSVTLCFPILIEMIGMAKCFWLFGTFLATSTLFIYLVVPETKGKTVAEIQVILGNT